MSPAARVRLAQVLKNPGLSRLDMKITSFPSGVKMACSFHDGLFVSCVLLQPVFVNRQKNSSVSIAWLHVSV